MDNLFRSKKSTFKNKVLLLHDFIESERRGMQVLDSSIYLTDLTKLISAIELSLNNGVIFETINTFSDEKKSRIEITIDDGGGSGILVANALKEINIRATFFVVTSFINKVGFLTKEEIKYIYSLGHRIGSHSHTHPSPFCNLDKKSISYEILKSKEILEDILKVNINTFSVPGGETDTRLLKLITSPKYKLSRIYTSTPYQGTYFKSNNIEVIGRLCILRKMNVNQIVKIMKGKDWVYHRFRYKIGRLKRTILYTIKSFSNSKKFNLYE